MKGHASFAAWHREQTAENQRRIHSLARLVRQVAPEFTKHVKWGQGCWTLDGDPRIYIHAEPHYVQFGFYRGSTLDDPEGLLEGSGKYVRHVKVFETRSLRRSALAELIRQVR